MKKNARTAALYALLHVDVNEGYSNLVLDKTLREFRLEARDASLASALFYGVLERRIALDYFISQFCKQPLKKTEPKVLEILRIAVYQILYMEKIPVSAAVNEAVACAKENGAVKASGFINGMLRSILRSKDKLAFPDPQQSQLRYLSIKYCCPEWLIDLWHKSYGETAVQGLLHSLLDKPPIYARVNTVRTTQQELLKKLKNEGVKATGITWVPGAISLEGTGSILQLDSFRQGLFHIQDLSSQLCCHILNPEPGQRLIDVCSAPGGKAFTLAEIMENCGEILAFDKFKGKVGLIRQGAERLGLSIIKAAVRDATEAKEPLEPAHSVLCDAPCSGLGIIRRKPEIRYKEKTSLDSLPDLQYLILCRSAQLTAAGGTLLYSTCTLNPAENSGVADRFEQAHPDFEPCPIVLPGLSRGIEEPENQLTLMPHIHGTDGFFIAAFRRRPV